MRIFALILALIGMGGSLQAATVGYTAPVAGSGSAIDTRPSAFDPEVRTTTFSRVVSGFDSSLGTLDSVEVISRINYRSIAELTGDGSFLSADRGEGTAMSSISVSLGGTEITSSSIDLGRLRCSDSIASSLPGCPTQRTLSRYTFVTSTFTAAEWASMVGNPVLNPVFAIRMRNEAKLIEGEEMRVTTSLFTGSFVRVNYSYTEPVTPPTVPLPAGLPLVLLGMGSLAALRGARRQG